MRKVKDVLYEIEQIKREDELLLNMIDKMTNEEYIANFMKENFGMNFMDIAKIRDILTNKAELLKTKLESIEVDF